MTPTTSDIHARAYYQASSTCHPRHVHTTILPWLQYISPTVRDIYAGAYYQASSMCYPWHVHTSILLSVQCMTPTSSDIHARVYYHHDSNICHPWRVTYMQEHITTSLVRATHDEWHVCKNTMSKTQVGQFPSQSSKGLTKPKVHPWWVPLIHTTMSPVPATL